MAQAFWDNVFAPTEFHYGTAVNDWVRLAVERYVLNGQWFANLGIDLPEELNVIELAAGEGRNAVWLAKQGFQVTAFDQSVEGNRKTRRLAAAAGETVTVRADDAIDLGVARPGMAGFR
jgi:2-polyprenyl-3-methyl-5-hydroxy-6-metoxy-1,4-benzoquinol methylase